MIKVIQMTLMLCLILSGALSYAHNAVATRMVCRFTSPMMGITLSPLRSPMGMCMLVNLR